MTKDALLPASKRKYLSFKEAQAYLDLSRPTLYRLCGTEIPYYDCVGGRKFTIEDLDEWIESKRVDIYKKGRNGKR